MELISCPVCSTLNGCIVFLLGSTIYFEGLPYILSAASREASVVGTTVRRMRRHFMESLQALFHNTFFLARYGRTEPRASFGG